jgi:hypothetical protein
MIRARNLIPEVYSESFDMSIFLGLIDLIYGARESYIERLKNAHSFRGCSEERIRSLAKLVGIDTSNRDLIANYNCLIKDKGTAETLKSLALLCGAAPRAVDNWVEINPTEGTIVFYVDTSGMDVDLFYDLLANLAPADAVVKLDPITDLTTDSTTDPTDPTDPTTGS